MPQLTLSYVLVILIFGNSLVHSYGAPEQRFTFKNRQKFLDFITNDMNFKNNVPPDYDNDKPTSIECEMHVENFDSINEANMDFTVTLLLHLSWYDQRFSHFIIESIESGGYVEIDAKNLEKLWVPDLYFPNEKNAYYHNVLMPNKMLRIYKGGSVTYSTRLSLTLSCPMDFRNYPFDKQNCQILIESFSYNVNNIILNWPTRAFKTNTTDNETHTITIDKIDKDKAVHLNKEAISMPQFEIIDIMVDQTSRTRRGLGSHSRLMVTFTLARNIGYYLVQMYIPSVLVVMLSWISFWLNVNAVPGRISLGVLTVLTMTTQSSGVNASLPHVSYTKAIDIWMSTCLMFVFFALIEFAVANVLMRKDTNKGFKFKNIFSIPRKSRESDSITNTTFTAKEKMIDDTKDVENGGGETSGIRYRKSKISNGVIYAMYCDVGSRIAFPVLFTIFNLVYWTYFLVQLHYTD